MQKSAMRTGSTSLTLHDARDGCSHDARPHVATHRRAWIETSRVAKVNCVAGGICTAHHSASQIQVYQKLIQVRHENQMKCESLRNCATVYILHRPVDSMAFAYETKVA